MKPFETSAGGDAANDRSGDRSELSAEFAVVARFFGADAGDADYSAITEALKTALIHDSFLCENRDVLPEVTSGVLRGLEAFGVAWFGRELAVRLYLSRDFDGVGQLAALHAAASVLFADGLESIDWLAQSVRYSTGEAQGGPSRNTRSRLMHQVIGAIALAGAEGRLKAGLQPFFTRALDLDASKPDIDPLTFLQGRLPDGSATWEYTRSGPDHQALFVAKLTTKDKRSSRGEGASKKLARHAAARAFIEQYIKPSTSMPPRAAVRRGFAMPSDVLVPDLTRTAVERIRHEFALPLRWRPLVLQALMHSSWVYEHAPAVKSANQKDNGLLAFVGSWVAICDYTRSIARSAQQTRPDGLAATTPTDQELAVHSGPLGLDAAMLLGRGEERSRGTRISVSSNAVQAMLAAIYIGLQTPPAIVDALSGRWSALSETLTPKKPRDADFKTALQELAAACDLDVAYGWKMEGPDHGKRFRAEVQLLSTVLGTSATIRGPWATSRKAAEKKGAEPAVEAFTALGPSLMDRPPPQVRGTVFVLSHLLAIAQMRPTIAERWARHGFLGTSIAEATELSRWATAADSFVEKHNITGVDSARLAAFYRQLTLRRDPLRQAAKLLTVVTQRLTELDDPSAIDASIEDDLAALGAVYRAAGDCSGGPSTLAETVSDWAVLYRGGLTVVGDTTSAELSPSERSMIDVLVGRMAEVHGALQVSFHASAMSVCSKDRQVGGSVAALVALFADLTAQVDIAVNKDALSFQFLTPALDTDGPIRRAVHTARISEPSQLSLFIANIVHDMKNQLAAARQAAAVPPGVTGTQRLSRQLIASQHLDQAKVLAAQLYAAGSLSATGIGTTEVSAYLRSYGAHLLQRLPGKYHVVTRSLVHPVTVAMDEARLGAILDNVVKNTQEALPDGGTIQLSAGADDVEVSIEFSDDGPGVSETIIEALYSGQSVQSTKINGNGLGLAGIRNLVQRAGGEFTYVRGQAGACWQITLPIADDTLEEESAE